MSSSWLGDENPTWLPDPAGRHGRWGQMGLGSYLALPFTGRVTLRSHFPSLSWYSYVGRGRNIYLPYSGPWGLTERPRSVSNSCCARILPSLPHVPGGHSVHGSAKGMSRRSKLNWGRMEKGRNRGTGGEPLEASSPCHQKQLLRSRRSWCPAGQPQELLIRRRRRAKKGSQSHFFFF